MVPTNLQGAVPKVNLGNYWGILTPPAIQTLGLLKQNSQLKPNSNFATIKCK